MTYNAETRLMTSSYSKIPHALVTMPKTAWYWLDDLVQSHFPRGGYKALVNTFAKNSTTPAELTALLGQAAQKHSSERMEELYNLANDNRPGLAEMAKGANIHYLPRLTVDLSARMPTCYQLFRFMPHATYLTTVWERRNFAKSRD